MTITPQFYGRGLVFFCLVLISCNDKIMKTSPDASAGNSVEPRTAGYLVHKPGEQKVEVWLGNSLFTNYLYAPGVGKPILYPLITSGGTVVTRGYPLDPQPGERADHPHHVGHWLNYGDVNGLDFWNNPGNPPPEKRDRYGFIVHRSVDNFSNPTKPGSFDIVADWQSPDGETLLIERTHFQFSQSGSTRSFVRTTTLTAAGRAVSFADNKEGMVAVRVARALELPDPKPAYLIGPDGKRTAEKVVGSSSGQGNYLSSEGLEKNAVWGTRARWMKMFGRVDDKPVAVVIFDHPDNVGFPTYWHARGYGLFSANPLGQKIFSKGEEELDFKLAPGESVTFKYKILVHEGNELGEEQLDRMFTEFASQL